MRMAVLLAVSFLVAAAGLPARAAAMQVTSQDIAPGATIAMPQVYGDCNGDNVSPQLAWSGAPAATRSFAVTVFDPDAPGGGWWHWIVFAIPPTRHELQAGAGDPVRTLLLAPAIQGTNDFGQAGYGGPCPPAGDAPHHYQFTVWALDTATPPFGAQVTGAKIAPWLESHALARAVLTARYGR